MPFSILTSHALSTRYSETPKRFSAKFLVSVSKSEFYNQKKVAYLLSALLNHQDLLLSCYFLFVYQTVLCYQSCTNLLQFPIAVANDLLSVLIALPTFPRAYTPLTK